MMHRRPRAAAAALFSLVVAGCGAGPSTGPSGLPVVTMTVAGKTVHLEVAADDKSREHGLMERDELADDGGMIFVFPREAERSFWMHHTRFPLDIIYAKADGTVVSVHTMRAYDEGNTPSGGTAMYAVELPVHHADGVKAGDKLDFPAEVGKGK